MTGQKIASISEQLDSSPTPRHLVDFISRQLLKAKFVDFTGKSINRSSSGFVVNAGSIVAGARAPKLQRTVFESLAPTQTRLVCESSKTQMIRNLALIL